MEGKIRNSAISYVCCHLYPHFSPQWVLPPGLSIFLRMLVPLFLICYSFKVSESQLSSQKATYFIDNFNRPLKMIVAWPLTALTLMCYCRFSTVTVLHLIHCDDAVLFGKKVEMESSLHESIWKGQGTINGNGCRHRYRFNGSANGVLNGRERNSQAGPNGCRNGS